LDVKLSTLEKELLVRAASKPQGSLSALFLSPAEKAGCKRLVKKGMMDNIMDTFYKLNEAGHVRLVTENEAVE
jgi:hypothetical protein